MPLKSLESLFSSERRSFLHLVNEAWRQNRRFCVRCHSVKIYRLADKRYRCARCGYTFHDFTRRWIGELNLTARQWLWVVKLFELEIPPTQLAKEVGISYPTALKAIYLIRRAIAQASGDDEMLAGENTSVRPGEEHARVFGLTEHNGKIDVSVVANLNLNAESVLREQPKFVKQGPIIFTGRFREYAGLILWRFRLPPGATKSLPKGKSSLDGLDSFWSFARPRLGKFHRTSNQDLFYFLKELVFRYEHRDEELFDSLVSLMTQLMPKT
ncbi:MAG: transposase [Candidatus Binatia bacterium]